MKRRPLLLALFLGVLAVVAAPSFTAPPLTYTPRSPAIDVPGPDLPQNVIPGAEHRVTWHAGQQRTAWSVVAIHGFSASRQETAPLAEKVADALGANLFEARLSGHGLLANRLVGVRAEAWLQDAAEAIAAGAALGDRVILIGTSTGATLMTAMLKHPLMSKVDTLVMISPNFAPRSATAEWATRPYGLLLARLLEEDTLSFEPLNARQEKYWTTEYPTESAIEVMRLVDRANGQLPTRIAQRLLVVFSPDDAVVSARAIQDAYEAIGARDKEIVQIDGAGDPKNHVIAGDIMSPGATQRVADTIVGFIRRPVP